MNDDVIGEENTIPIHLNPPIRFEFFLILVKVLIAVMFMFPLAHYSMYGDRAKEQTPDKNETVSVVISTSEKVGEARVVKFKQIVQPSCPIAHLKIFLQEICEDYSFQSTSCTPGDFNNIKKHDIPVNSARKNSIGDPRANIVGFATVGLLVVLLTAAFLELYKAKKQAPAKTKAPLTRKCSLADLTVMKHHRKELMRRDSILENPEHAKQPVELRRIPPLQRSSSTPAEPLSEGSSYVFNRSLDSRRGSIVDHQQYATYNMVDSRTGNEGKRGMFDSRKASIIDGKFVDRYDMSGRRISVDISGSPERKHHSRLVHRH